MECVYCGGPADTDDHLVPRAIGGTDDPSNLVPACRPCNSRKGVQLGFRASCGNWTWRSDGCFRPDCMPCQPAQVRRDEEKVQLALAGSLARWSIRCRNQTIRRAYEAGGSLREIAELVGLSHMGVKAIIEKIDRAAGRTEP